MLALSLLLALPLSTATVQLAERLVTWPDGSVRERYEERKEPDGTRVRHGDFESFYESGERKARGTYVDGVRDGTWTFYWPNGERRARGRMKGGVRDGRWACFTEDGGKDEHESGVYRPYAELREDGSGEVGALLDKLKHGEWRYVGAGGRPLFEGGYDHGVAQGTWVVHHADGSVEQGWLTGRYVNGERAGDAPADELEPADAAPVAWTPAPELVAAADGVARGDDAAARALAPRALFGALAWRIGRCDLAEAGEAAEARGLHDALTELCGAGWAWAEAGAAGAAEQNRRTALRWGTLAELLRCVAEEDDVHWERDFARKWIPRVDVEHTVLAHPPLPGTFHERSPLDGGRHPTSSEDARFAGRIGGARDLRAAASPLASALQDGLAWLAQQVELGASGPLDDGELLTLVALFGDGQAIGTTHGEAVETLLVREVLAEADRHAGRLERPRSLMRRALATHVLARSAISEGLPSARQAAAWAAADLIAAQAERGAWPRELGQARGDPATTAVALVALLLAAKALPGLPGVDDAVERAAAWLEERVDPRTGAVPTEELDPASIHGEPAATAATALALVFAGRGQGDPALQRLFGWLAKNPPRLDRPDHLELGVYAAREAGGDLWKAWSKDVKELVVGSQLDDGSWRAAGPRDGRATTALMASALEVHPPGR